MIKTWSYTCKAKQLAGAGLLAVLCLMASGCFTIEQEIFLDADGGGDVVLHITIPDIPEELSKSSMGLTAGKTSPGDDLAKFKSEVTTSLPPAIKLKEVKEVKQNGSTGFYAVFQFKDLNEMESVLANLGKGSLKEGDLNGNSEWKMRLDRIGDKSRYTASFLIDIQGSGSAQKRGEKKAEKTDAADDISKQLMPLFLGSVKVRFILHTPSPITETNADIVLRGRTAVWDCSLITFLAGKKPVRMTATY
jgi:hypothetical protein